MSKEEFKIFARKNPSLANSVLNGKTSWQKLYEMYDIYGESSSIWNNFIEPVQSSVDTSSFKELFNTFRNLDMESVQKGVTNLQKTVGLLQELGLGTKESKKEHEAKPLYKYFED